MYCECGNDENYKSNARIKNKEDYVSDDCVRFEWE